MFSKAVLVLLATFAVLVPCQSHFLERRGQECGDDLTGCMVMMMQYQAAMEQAGGPEKFAASASLREHCTSITEITTCMRSTVQGSCAGVFEQPELGMILNAIGLVDYICVEKLSDFERHEQCFLNAKFDEDVAECRPNIEKCDLKGFSKCAKRAMAQTPGCNRESQKLFDGLMRKMIKIVPGCRARKELQTMFEMLVYRK